VVSYLPMAHVAERINTHYLAMAIRAEVTPVSDGGKLNEHVRRVRPHIRKHLRPRQSETSHARRDRRGLSAADHGRRPHWRQAPILTIRPSGSPTRPSFSGGSCSSVRACL
jgi:hypothetical protein